MSTAVSAVGGVIGLAALPAVALGLVAFGALKALSAISETDKKAVHTLEKKKASLKSKPIRKSTPKEMLSKFKEDQQVLSETLKPLKLTVEDEAKFSNVYALETSGLGDFIPLETLEMMEHKPSISTRDFNRILSESVSNLKKISLDYTVKTAIQSAVEIGFDHKVSVKKTLIGTYITTVNKIGQSIVTLANSTDEGVKINADTTGFQNGECTIIMANFTAKLQEKGIELSGLRVKEHWKKEGILNDYISEKQKEISMPANEQTIKSNNEAKMKAEKRRIRNIDSQSKLKN
jgi:hypothetical protein